MAEKHLPRAETLRAIVTISDRLFDLLKLAVKVTFWIFFVISAADIVEAIGGQSTSLDIDAESTILVKLWSGLDLGCKWAWVVAIIGFVYGILQSHLRRRKVKYMAARITDLEIIIDPKRTTSGLTKKGDTPKGG